MLTCQYGSVTLKLGGFTFKLDKLAVKLRKKCSFYRVWEISNVWCKWIEWGFCFAKDFDELIVGMKICLTDNANEFDMLNKITFDGNSDLKVEVAKDFGGVFGYYLMVIGG